MGRSTAVLRWVGALAALVVAALVTASALAGSDGSLPEPVQVAAGAVPGDAGDGLRELEQARVVSALPEGSTAPATEATAGTAAGSEGSGAGEPQAGAARPGSSTGASSGPTSTTAVPSSGLEVPAVPTTSTTLSVDPLGDLLRALPLIGTTTTTAGTPSTAPPPALPLPLPPLPLPLPLPGG